MHERELAAGPEPIGPAAIGAAQARARSLRDHLRLVASIDPARQRDVLHGLDARVVIRGDKAEIVYPEEVSALLGQTISRRNM